MRKIFNEPLVHFLILGLALFAGHNLWARHVSKADYTIYVSSEEMQRQAAIFASENQRPPDDQDLQGLLFAHIEEQALMREALRLELDDNDTIIRRRLAQKMRFMIEDAAPPNVPPDDVLKAWFDERPEQFVNLEKRAFSHVYFSPQVHGDNIEAAVLDGIHEIKGENWKSLGDPFILQKQYGPQTLSQVSREFGVRFAARILNLKMRSGPARSSRRTDCIWFE